MAASFARVGEGALGDRDRNVLGHRVATEHTSEAQIDRSFAAQPPRGHCSCNGPKVSLGGSEQRLARAGAQVAGARSAVTHPKPSVAASVATIPSST